MTVENLPCKNSTIKLSANASSQWAGLGVLVRLFRDWFRLPRRTILEQIIRLDG